MKVSFVSMPIYSDFFSVFGNKTRKKIIFFAKNHLMSWHHIVVVNKKRKRITVQTNITSKSERFDLLFENAEVVE